MDFLKYEAPIVVLLQNGHSNYVSSSINITSGQVKSVKAERIDEGWERTYDVSPKLLSRKRIRSDDLPTELSPRKTTFTSTLSFDMFVCLCV